jgi:hypothetical protein
MKKSYRTSIGIFILLFAGLLLTTKSVNAGTADWKILVLVYASTDFSFTDGDGNAHHVIATMSDEEKSRAESSASYFFQTDVPLLTSGYMSPTATIRFPTQSLSDLEESCGYWPSPNSTAADLDPAFDSVIVIWKSSGIDQTTGLYYDLQQCGGLAAYRGNAQTYAAFQVDSIGYNQRNIFKHEWGHSILFYFDAAGTSPKPAVDNHINSTTIRYVHCRTGTGYILIDEDDDNPIPNSIYNNFTGFTHDYYSGTTALPQQPSRCLGINANAWASDGPVTIPIPQPIAPADDAVIFEPLPLLQWGKIADGMIYEVELDSTEPPTTLIYASGGTTYKLQTALGLLPISGMFA